MSITRDSFIFYRSFYEAIKDIPKAQRAAIYEAVFAYVFEGEEPALRGVTSALWRLIKPQLDANNARYENGKKGAEFGSRGGRPKGAEKNPSGDKRENPKGVAEKTPKGLENAENENPKETPNENVNENENVNVNANANGARGFSAGSAGLAESAIPAFKDVADEVAAKGYRVSAAKFFEYYETAHWKTTKGEPIRNWKAMLKAWDMKEHDEPPGSSTAKSKGKNGFNDFDQRSYTEEELEAALLEVN